MTGPNSSGLLAATIITGPPPGSFDDRGFAVGFRMHAITRSRKAAPGVAMSSIV
jgi:hypothetical protein